MLNTPRGSSKLVLLATVSLALLGATPSLAQQRPQNALTGTTAAQTYDIRAQALQPALNQFASQSDREILFSSEIVAGRQTGGVRGAHSDAEALLTLLRGTGLTFRQAPSGAFLIERQSALTPASATGGSSFPSAGVPSAAGSQSQIDDQTTQVDDIVVTASLRNERARDVPSSVTALGSEQLRDLQATRFDDFISQVPNISFSGNRAGNRQIILRGITTSTFEQSATVATYVDDVAIGSSTALAVGARFKPDINVFDLDRIEVLRGPQGTLYGANSLGGLLKYVTIAPSTAGFEALARVEANSVSHGGQGYGVDGAVNIPLGDQFALRLSGFQHEEGGWIDDVSGRQDVNELTSSGGRASLLGHLGDRLTVRGTAMYQKFRTGASSVEDIRGATGALQYGPYLQQRSIPEPNTQEFQLYSAGVDYDLGFATLTSTTSYVEIAQENRSDFSQFDAGTFPGFDFYPDRTRTTTKRFTEEVRLTSEENHRLEWLVGAFYTREDSLRNDKEIGATRPDADIDAPGAPLAYLTTDDSRYEQLAGYGDVTVYFGDNFDVTGGVRYTQNDTQLLTVGDGFYNGGSTVQRGSATDDAWTFLLTPRLRLSDDTMVYARAAKGFRPGSPNLLSPAAVAAGAQPSFESDSLWNYEAGIKTATADRSLSADFTVFYIDWSQIQIRQAVGGFAFVGNGGKASSKGAELAVTARPTEGFTASFNLGYTDAVLEEDALSVGGSAGAPLPNAPKWTYGGALDYEFGLTGSINANVGASWRMISNRFADFNRSLAPRLSADGYGTLDLYAGLKLDRVDISLFAKNVTDTRGVDSLDTVFFPASQAVSRPRTVGIAVTARY